MTIEEYIFKRSTVNFAKLKDYGFNHENDTFIFEKTFFNNQFKAIVCIDKFGNVSGTVYDLESNDIYLPLRVENLTVGYIGQIKIEYEKILEDIKKHCFTDNFFIGAQANRITRALADKYGDIPDFPWEKSKNYGVFRNPDNDKWYALIMNIDKNKLDKKQSGEVEIVNIKLDEDEIQERLKQKGFYAAYHMNKKSWITLVLDDTLNDDVILALIDQSHQYTFGRRTKNRLKNLQWIIPANPKYFDLEDAFNKNNVITWKQSNDMKIGDIAYIYMAAPCSAVLYKCKVTDVNIPYSYEDKNIKINKVMKIELLKRYNDNFMTFEKLKKFGINAVRGPRICPQELNDILK